MPRNRVLAQSESLFCGPSPSTGYHFYGPTGGVGGTGGVGFGTGYAGYGDVSSTLVNQLTRVQSANYDFSIARKDVREFGQLGPVGRIVTDYPTVSLDFNYLSANLYNERILGMTVSSGTFVPALSGYLTKNTLDRNYFIKVVNEGFDEIGNPQKDSAVIGVGNGYITSYRTEGSVGNFPTCSVKINAYNLDFTTGVSGTSIPALNTIDGSPITTQSYALPTGTTSATGQFGGTLNEVVLRPYDTVVDITAFNGANGIGAVVSDLKIQSYSLSWDLQLEALKALGSKYPYCYEPRFPVNVNLSVSAMAGDVQSGRLIDFNNNADTTTYSVGLKIYQSDTPISQRSDATVAAYYLLRGAVFDNQSTSSPLDGDKTISMSFSAQISGPTVTGQGLFLSGQC